MSHGLKNAQEALRIAPARCPRVFIPSTRAGGRDYRRACLCGADNGHEGQHYCLDCGGKWGTEPTAGDRP